MRKSTKVFINEGKKKKRLLAFLMAGTMVASLAASGEGIRLVNGKPEIDSQLQTLAAKYQEETGNVVTVETAVADART